jgi:hypothetical protein
VVIKDFFQKRKQLKAERDFQQSPLGVRLTKHTQQYFSTPRLSNFTEQKKLEMIGDFSTQIITILNSDNPVLALREKLADYVCCYSDFQVLCLTEEEKAEASYSTSPYISGELYRCIDKAVPFNDELRHLVWKYADISNSTLISFCNTSCVVNLYYMNGLHYVRLSLNDYDDIKDWGAQFTKSMLICSEDTYRNKMGLPSLSSNSLNGMVHGSFMSMVLNGHHNPLYEWEKKWPNYI